MKPRNKTEQRLVQLQSELHPVYKRDQEWVCNHYDDMKKNNNYAEYFGILEVVEDYQVVRWLINMRYGRKAKGVEVMQMWINKRHVYYFTKSRQCLGNCYIDSWCFDTDMQFRGHYDDCKYISRDLRRLCLWNVRIHSLIPQFKYGNVDKHTLLYGTPYYTFRYLSNPHYSTIAQIDTNVANWCKSNFDVVETIFTAWKITKRNKYAITDADLWCDYIMLLSKNGLDIRNAHYVCPDDLQHAHTWAMGIENTRIERKNAKVMEKENEEFLKHHKHFLDIAFSNDLLYIHSLDSVPAYISEGHIMSHCVGHLMKYYKKPNSLILTCHADGKKIATIEVDINDERIVQIRGYKDCVPPHYEEIKQLVTDNLGIVAERKAEQNKKQTKVA